MNVTTEHIGGAVVIRVSEPRLTYPILADFATVATHLIGAGGHLKLSGVQKRVETMLTMTGAQNFIEIHADEPTAVKSFGA